MFLLLAPLASPAEQPMPLPREQWERAGRDFLHQQILAGRDVIEVLPQLPGLEIFRIYIEIAPGGKIEIVAENGARRLLGHVKEVPTKVNFPAFTAAKWGQKSSVVATAVNAVHLLIDVVGNRGVIYSILPSGENAEDEIPSGADYPASIVTDILPGTALFGHNAPPVHSPCFVQRQGELLTLRQAQRLATGDTLVIIAQAKPYFREIEIENQAEGLIHATDIFGGRNLIGRVARPVRGVGRFHGSEFAFPGRLRANHPGVICVSTSLPGEVGGFQIIPIEHASSTEMLPAWQLAQWLIVAPPPEATTMPGTSPLFGGILGPYFSPQALHTADWKEKLLRRVSILADYGDGSWRPLPVVAGRNDTALAAIRRLLIRLPVF